MIAIAWAAFIIGGACVLCGLVVCVRSALALLNEQKKVAAHPLLASLGSASAIPERLERATAKASRASARLQAALTAIGATAASASDYAATVAILATTIEELLAAFVPHLRGDEGLG